MKSERMLSVKEEWDRQSEPEETVLKKNKDRYRLKQRVN